MSIPSVESVVDTEIPLRIKKLIAKHFFRQADVARAAGVSPNYLSQCLSNSPTAKRKVNLEIVVGLARLISNQDLVWLLRGDTKEYQEKVMEDSSLEKTAGVAEQQQPSADKKLADAVALLLRQVNEQQERIVRLEAKMLALETRLAGGG